MEILSLLSEAFVVLILMTSWLTSLEGRDDREIEMLELFAGQARISRLGKACGIPCEAHDWDFDKDAKSSNFDITGPAGLVILSVNTITGFGGNGF